MKTVYVHGRNQGGKDAAELATLWDNALAAGCASAGCPNPVTESVLPFYGDALDARVAAVKAGVANVVHRGPNDDSPDPGVSPEDIAFVQALLDRSGVTPAEISAQYEAEVIERGPQNWEWFQAACRAVSAKAQWIADLGIAKATADVNAYLYDLLASDAVHSIIEPAVTSEPCIVIAHSLGSVVAYRLLAELGTEADVALLLTVGSPIAIPTIKQALVPPRLQIPAGVRRWVNVSDERDFIALHSSLTGDTFLDGIENISDLDNGDDPHSIVRYLSQPRVGGVLGPYLV